MIPRFIVKNSSADLISKLIDQGYSCNENPVPEHILVIGNSIVQAPSSEKNELIRCYNLQTDNINVVFNQAKLHIDWQSSMVKKGYKTAIIGTKLTQVFISEYGVLIDSFVIPILVFEDLVRRVKGIIGPLTLVTHEPKINPKVPFVTIGCADYSIDDFNKIMQAYTALTTKS